MSDDPLTDEIVDAFLEFWGGRDDPRRVERIRRVFEHKLTRHRQMMTIEKCREVLDRYADKLSEYHHRVALDHLASMIPTMRTMLDEMEAIDPMVFEAYEDHAALREKFMRWLGFMQGVLYSEGVYTIDQMKDHNRPTTAP
jgi:hypothetical protein